MRIKDIHINGFGIFHSFNVSDLSTGLNVFFGPNEAGKSTLFEFIHRLLFGFPRGRQKKNFNPYNPLSGGKKGGRLVLEHEDSRILIIERFDNDKQDVTVTRLDGSRATQEDLQDFLGHVTSDVYKDVFAFGLQELSGLQEQSLKRLYGAGLGLKRVSLTDVLDSLEKDAVKIFKTTRGETLIKKSLRDLEQIRKEIRILHDHKEQYEELAKKLKQIENAISQKNKTFTDLQTGLEHLRILQKAWSFWVERKHLEKELQEIPDFPGFPENGMGRLENLKQQLKNLRLEQNSLKQALDSLEKENEFNMGKVSTIISDYLSSPPEVLISELEDKQRNISLLQIELSSRKDKIHKIEKLGQKRSALKSQLTMAQMTKPAPVAPMLLPGLIPSILLGIFSAVLFMQAEGGIWIPIAACLAAVFLAAFHIVFVISRKKPEKDQEQQFEPIVREIKTCEQNIGELTQIIEKADQEIGKTADELGLSSLPGIEELENKRSAITKISEHLTVYVREKKDHETRLKQIEMKMEAGLQELNELLKAGSTKNPEEFRSHAAASEKRKTLDAKLREADKNILLIAGNQADSLEKELKNIKPELLDSDLKKREEKLKELQEHLEQLRQDKGEYTEKMRSLEIDQIPVLRAREEQILAELEQEAWQWGVLRLARFCLLKARERYEQERQPLVLKEAQRFFKKMTGNRYQRISFPEQEKQFLVFDGEKKRKNPFLLSRGALEQLYLSVRFGLIKSYEFSKTVLPIMTDDVLVNFDPERAELAAQAFLDLALSHQVLFFTCHPETCGYFKKLKPDLSIYNL